MLDQRTSEQGSPVIGQASLPIAEAQAEVDSTANAAWVHSGDTLAVARKSPDMFTGHAWSDLTQAYDRLGEAIKIVLTKGSVRNG